MTAMCWRSTSFFNCVCICQHGRQTPLYVCVCACVWDCAYHCICVAVRGQLLRVHTLPLWALQFKFSLTMSPFTLSCPISYSPPPLPPPPWNCFDWNILIIVVEYQVFPIFRMIRTVCILGNPCLPNTCLVAEREEPASRRKGWYMHGTSQWPLFLPTLPLTLTGTPRK